MFKEDIDINYQHPSLLMIIPNMKNDYSYLGLIDRDFDLVL